MIPSTFIEVSVPGTKQHYVYVLMLRDVVIYVGQTKNLVSRLEDHAKLHVFDRAFALPVEREERLDVEAAIARHLKPSLSARYSTKNIERDAEILARFGFIAEAA